MIHSTFSLTHENMYTCGGPSVTQRRRAAWVEQKHSSSVVSAHSHIFYFCLSFLSSACQKCWGETFLQYRHHVHQVQLWNSTGWKWISDHHPHVHTSHPVSLGALTLLHNTTCLQQLHNVNTKDLEIMSYFNIMKKRKCTCSSLNDALSCNVAR